MKDEYGCLYGCYLYNLSGDSTPIGAMEGTKILELYKTFNESRKIYYIIDYNLYDSKFNLVGYFYKNVAYSLEGNVLARTAYATEYYSIDFLKGKIKPVNDEKLHGKMYEYVEKYRDNCTIYCKGDAIIRECKKK